MASSYRTEVAGLPEGGPATLAGVKALLGITDARDDDRLTAVVNAVNSVVRCWPVSGRATTVTPSSWDAAPDVVEGSTLLASRLFRRKNSPAGVEAFGSNGAVYVQRNDPDVAMMLQLGPYAPPMIG